MLVIADAAKPLVIAGIMGGANAEVDDTTTDLVLEVAYFQTVVHPLDLAETGLSTDSSYRYERGVDPHTLLEDAASHHRPDPRDGGGRSWDRVHGWAEDRPWENEINLTPAYVRRQLGFDVADDAMKSALAALELPIVRDELTATDSRNGPYRFPAGAATSIGPSIWWKRSCDCMGPIAFRRARCRPRAFGR